jgi:hemolysin activation/secretion protein
MCLWVGALDMYAPVAPKVTMDKVVERNEVEEASQALITLKNIQFKGVKVLGDLELKGIVEPYLNTPMTYEQMLEVGMVIESYYLKNNYLARAIFPPQDLTDGVLMVDVMESVFSKVEIEQELEDLPNTQAHVTSIIRALQPTGQPFHTESLNHALTLANGVQDISDQGSLLQDREADETELLLKLYQDRTRQTELSLDNGDSRVTGGVHYLATLNWFKPNDLVDLLNIVGAYAHGSEYVSLVYSVVAGIEAQRSPDTLTLQLANGGINLHDPPFPDEPQHNPNAYKGLVPRHWYSSSRISYL